MGVPLYYWPVLHQGAYAPQLSDHKFLQSAKGSCAYQLPVKKVKGSSALVITGSEEEEKDDKRCEQCRFLK